MDNIKKKALGKQRAGVYYHGSTIIIIIVFLALRNSTEMTF